MSIRKDKPLILSLLVLAFVVTGCAVTPTPDDTMHTYTSQVSNMAQSVVAVDRISNNRISLVGSAVVIRCEAGKPIRLLTAYHVPEAIEERDGQGDAPILIGNGYTRRYQQVKLLAKRPGWDLAVLEGFIPEEKSCPSVPIASTLPEIGSPVWLVGNPLGHEKNITHGILSHVYFTQFFKDKPLVYRIDAAAGPGNSGGGLFNNKGELIGILSFGELVGFGSFLPGGGHAIGLPHIWVMLKNL